MGLTFSESGKNIGRVQVIKNAAGTVLFWRLGQGAWRVSNAGRIHQEDNDYA